MKKVLLSLFTVLAIASSVEAQDKVKEADVPRAVLLAIENTYTSYSVRAWFASPGQYIADFTTDGQRGKAYFTDDGEWQYSSFDVNIEECPTIMDSYFIDNYPGFKIRSINYIEEMSGDNYYRMIIARKGVSAQDYELIFDTRGKLTKTNAPDPDVVRRDFIARNNPEEDLDEKEAPNAPTKGSKGSKKKGDIDIDSDVEAVTPPDAVKKNFEKRYPAARVKSGPEWVMRDEEFYVAYFTNNAKVNFDAVFTEDGKMTMVGTTLAEERYPRPVTKYLAEKLKDEKYDIMKIVRYDYDSKYRDPSTGKKPKSFFYAVVTQKVKGKKGKKFLRMTFDNTGKFTGLLAMPLDEKDIR